MRRLIGMPVDIFDSTHYFFNPYAVPSLLIALATVLLSLRCLITERFSPVAVTLALDGVAIVIWLTSNFFVYSAAEETLSIQWAKASYLGIPFIPAATCHFAVVVLRKGEKYNKIIWTAWLLSALFAVTSMVTDLIVDGVIRYRWGYTARMGSLNFVLILYILILYGFSHRLLWLGQKEAAPGSLQSYRIKALQIALGIGSLGLVDFLDGAGIPVYPFGFLGIFIALWILNRTISKYRLIDITPHFAAQSILDTMNDALIALDQERVIRLVNNAAARVLGHSQSRLVGRHMSSIFGSSTASELFHNPANRWMIQDVELSYNHPDGSERKLSLSASLMKDEQGQPLVYVFIVRDITRIKQAEAEIIKARDELELRVEERSADLKKTNEQMMAEICERKKVEEELSTIFNLVPDMITVLSSDGHFRKLNGTWNKVLGFDPEELLLKPFIAYIHPEDVSLTMNEIQWQIEKKSTINFVNRFRCKSGAYKWLEWAFSSSQDGTLLFGTARDISVRKRMEEERRRTQKLESLGVLAGGIAHDFNNLLTSILGNISLVRLDLDPDHASCKQLEDAERASLLARDLTQHLLTFSKGGAPIKKATDLNQLIRDTVCFAVRGTNVKVEFDFAQGLWPVEADRGQLEQVFNNLVINSCQAMPTGGTVWIHAENMTAGQRDRTLTPGGKYVRITVKDPGVGIPEEHHEKIFDPYFTTKQRGSGLGLAVSYSIIRNHDGCISVDSKPGAGAKFTIELPATDKTVLVQKVAAVESVEGTGRVLIMDDEKIVRNTARSIIERLGYTVETAEDGADAIKIYKEAEKSGRSFDVVIMDLTIPGGMGGKEAIEKLHEIDPDIKAIVSSGYSDDPIMANHEKYGFKAVIAKPYTTISLGKVLQKVIAAS